MTGSVDRGAPRFRFRGIYGVVDTSSTSAPLALLAQLLDAQVQVMQFRAKDGVDRAVVRAMLGRTRAAGAQLIINDDLGAALEADGWHSGQEDLAGLDLAVVRRQLGSRFWGISCETPDEAIRAQAAGADYVGIGPFAVTATKADAGAPIGAAGIAAVVRAVSIPVIAIGGIDLDNLATVARSGARMAAVISAIAHADAPRTMADRLQRRWHEVAR